MATIPPPEGEDPVMPEPAPKAPSPLSFPDFRYFWLARFTAVMATIAMVVVIGYQLYDTARSDYGMSIKEASFQLGLLGLFQFVPLDVPRGNVPGVCLIDEGIDLLKGGCM